MDLLFYLACYYFKVCGFENPVFFMLRVKMLICVCTA